MTGEELTALRQLLFLSVAEACALSAGISEATWQAWEEGRQAPSGEAVAAIQELLRWRAHAYDAASDEIRRSRASGRRVLVWYDKAADWASLPGRSPAYWRPHQSVCAALLAAFPETLRLVRFDARAYAAWLAGRQDSEAMRAAWALEQV